MAQRALTARPLLEAYHYAAPASFVLPTEVEWQMIKDMFFVFKGFGDCVLSLQGDDKMLAHFFP